MRRERNKTLKKSTSQGLPQHHQTISFTILCINLHSFSITLALVSRSSFLPHSSAFFFGDPRHTRGLGGKVFNPSSTIHHCEECLDPKIKEKKSPTLFLSPKASSQSYRAVTKMKGFSLLRLVSILLLINFTAAWPWPDSYRDIEGLIVRRQETSPTGMSGFCQHRPINADLRYS